MKNIDRKQILKIHNMPKFSLADKTTTGQFTQIGETPEQLSAGQFGASTAENVISTASSIGNTLTSLSSGVTPAFTVAGETLLNGMQTLPVTVSGTGTSALGTALGAVGSVAGMALGSMLMAKSVNQINNALTPNDIMKMSNTAKEYGIAGRQYQALHAPGNQAMQYANRNIRQGAVGAALGGLSAGAGAGSLIGMAAGSAVPVIGTAIGAGVGAIVGGLTGVFKGIHAKKEAKHTLNDTAYAFDNYNRQQMGTANTLGMRDEYNEKYGNNFSSGTRVSSAANGKQSYGNMDKASNTSKVNKKELWTPEGVVRTSNAIDYANSRVDYGEILANPYTGGTAIVDEDGKSHKTGKVDEYLSSIQDGDQNIILSNKKYINGSNITYALAGYEDAKLAQMYKLLADNPMTSKDSKMKHNKLNYKHINNLYLLAQHQNQNGNGNSYKCGKLPGFVDAHKIIGLANPIVNGIAGLGAIGSNLGQYFYFKKQKPAYQNPYNINESAERALNNYRNSIKMDLTPYDDFRSSAQEGTYAINHSGAYTPGLRLAALTNHYNNYMNGRANILNTIRNKYNDDVHKYFEAELNYRNADAQRQFAGNQFAMDNYAKANSVRSSGMWTALNAIPTNIGNLGNKLIDNYGDLAMLDIYDANAKNDVSNLSGNNTTTQQKLLPRAQRRRMGMSYYN